MPKINLQTGKIEVLPTSSEIDKLLSDDFSDTKISDTNDEVFSSTNVSEISSTNISDTKLSATKYMNQYKRDKYDTVRVDFPKGTKVLLKQEAAQRGISLQRLVKDALREHIKGR